jgi:hypothetical protein
MAAKATTLQDLYRKLEAFQNEVRSEFKILGASQRELRQYTESGFETMLTRFDWLEDRFDRLEDHNGNYEH